MEHVGDPLRALSEVRRVLKPGSPIVVTEVQNSVLGIISYLAERYLVASSGLLAEEIDEGGGVGVRLADVRTGELWLAAIGF
ncbi:MAG: hypothetical protein IH920_06115 [Chloroflexi bacterium]|nr:hypothetical protein [Chloroflexota bacterium]